MYNIKLTILLLKNYGARKQKEDLHYRRINPSTTRHGGGCFNILKLVNETFYRGTTNFYIK